MTTSELFINSPVLQTQEKILLSIIEKQEAIVIFDIGACEGESSIRYARLFPKAAIYSFEPLPSNFQMITDNIHTWHAKNIFPFQLCLSDKEEVVSFHVSSGKPENTEGDDWNYGNKSSSLLSPAKTTQIHPWLKFENMISVQATTLKNFCALKNINSVDFIHMDVQGAELMVLNGAQDFITHINMVWLEVEAVELYKGQPLKKDIEEFMTRNGFVKIEDTVYAESGDQFWVKNEYIHNKKGNYFLQQKQILLKLKRMYKSARKFLNI